MLQVLRRAKGPPKNAIQVRQNQGALYASIASTMTPKQVHYITEVAQRWCWLVPTVNFQQHAGTHARMYARTHTHTHTRRPFFSFHPFIPPFLPAYLFLHLSRPFTTRRPLSSHRKRTALLIKCPTHSERERTSQVRFGSWHGPSMYEEGIGGAPVAVNEEICRLSPP